MKNAKILILFILITLISFKRISNNQIIYNNNYCQYNLEIKDLNFNKCLYIESSKLNSIDYGLEVFHDNPLVIIGHSGTKENAVFNEIISIKQNSIININYPNHENETYIVNKKYEKNKQDNLVLESNLILVTCSRKDLTKQIVIVASLIKQNSINSK